MTLSTLPGGYPTHSNAAELAQPAPHSATVARLLVDYSRAERIHPSNLLFRTLAPARHNAEHGVIDMNLS